MSDTKVHYPSPGRIKTGRAGDDVEDAQDSPDGFEPAITIAHDHIRIGDVTLRGIWIEHDGVTVLPGSAEITRDGRCLRDSSRVSVTFIVGDIDIEADAIDHVRVQQPLAHAISIATALDPIPDEFIEHEIPEPAGDDATSSTNTSRIAVQELLTKCVRCGFLEFNHIGTARRCPPLHPGDFGHFLAPEADSEANEGHTSPPADRDAVSGLD